MSRRVQLIAVLLPLLAVIVGIVRAELHFGGARNLVFQVAGYDPRDLLRGRYLQFRLRVSSGEQRGTCAGDDCCACVDTRGPVAAVSATRRPCDALPQCDAVLRARYLDEPLRYYVPELEARRLEEELQNAMQHQAAHVVLAVDPSGHAEVRALRLHGREIPGAVQ